MARFYNDYSGSISIDGVNIKEFTNESFRRFVGMVQQDNFIFNDTIYKNITYGSVGFTENDIIEACKKASLYKFIMSLPDKFDTVVGPRGLKLSGGQKQRIALARIFLRNPEIVIFDEATSALDNTSETIIQEAIEKLEGKTVITVAHRLSTIKDCDKIIVIDNHKIAEMGTHDELIAKKGIYASLQK